MKKINSTFIIAGAAVLILLLLFGSRMYVILKPGEKGVMFRPYSTGLDKDRIFDEGFEIIAPWNTMIVYEVREQKVEETMDILDKKGLSIKIDVTVRFHPVFSKIGYIHAEFSQDYIQRLVVPEVRSSVRKVTGRYEAEEIYSTKRNEVEAAIINEAAEALNANNVNMKALLIRSIQLPDRIKNAIDEKEEQRQVSEAYQYRLEKEEKEKQRKIIAAQGEAEANKIINSSLTRELLRMRGIEATIELSKSNNSKVVVVGSGKDGLPLILGNN